MRQARARWPRLPAVALAGICFVTVVVLDLAIEGQIFMRLGFYDESGYSFLHSKYSHNPIRNILLFAIVFTAASCLRFFRNDRGQTLVERGAEGVNGLGKATALRFFAVLAAVQVILGLGYHLPMTIWTTQQPNAGWHQDMRNNSYMNDHICGVGTPRSCPGA